MSPLRGVYAVVVHGLGPDPRPGVANIGTRPTVNGQGCRLEVHLFDFDETIYGRHIQVEFRLKLREEKRFDSFEDLKRQIQLDAAARGPIWESPTTGMHRAYPRFPMPKTKHLIARATRLIDRLERLLPAGGEPAELVGSRLSLASSGRARVATARACTHRIALEDLLCLERQKEDVARNTRQFLAGKRANNVLLWGSRGTGKSSLVKAVFNAHRDAGLRLIEVDKDDLIQLPDILELLGNRPERFVLYCDDLSFEASESGYKALKAALDGSITATPDNLLIYATSNRRHLLPEFQSENRESRILDGELHPGESVEEKISLSDRFGLWVAFHPFSQAQYLSVVRHWLGRLQRDPIDWSTVDWEPIERNALQWALHRGSRSGRTAWQFALDWAGREDRERPPGAP